MAPVARTAAIVRWRAPTSPPSIRRLPTVLIITLILQLRAQRLRTHARRVYSDGSIDTLGSRFGSFGINELEVVALTGASWNRMVDWLAQLDRLRTAADHAFLRSASSNSSR